MALNLHHFGLKSPIHGNPYAIEDMKMSPHEMDLISSSRRGGGSNDDIGSSDEMDHLEYDRERGSCSPSSVSACSSSPDGGNHKNNNRKKNSFEYRTPMSRLNNQPQRQIFPQSHRGGGKQNENIMSMYEDSPLDFSTKRPKVNLKKEAREDSVSPIDEPDSPCSKLRHRLIMKNAESMGIPAADALNLTKISPTSNDGSPDWVSPKGNNRGANLSYNISESLTSPTGYSSVYNIHSPLVSPIITPTAIPGLGMGMPGQMFVPLGVTATSAGSPGLPFSTGLQQQQPNLVNNNGKGSARSTRPFKAYPKDPLAFPTMGLYGLSLGSGPQVQDSGYEKFQDEMLKQVSITRNKRNGKKSGGGGNNCPVSDSTTSSTSPSNYTNMENADLSNSGSDICQGISDGDGRQKSGEHGKDEAYWERRRKNNEAAKRSRDARRKKEDQIAIRCAYLEQENFTLRFELHELRNKYNHLHQNIAQ